MMKLHDNGDIIKALGFVALHSAYLEDELAELTAMVVPHRNLHKNVGSFRVAEQAKHLRKTIKEWFSEIEASSYPVTYIEQELQQANKVLKAVEDIAKLRNEVLHSPILGDGQSGSIQKNKHAGNRTITSKEVYELAECINNISGQVYGLQFIVGRLHQSTPVKSA